MLIDLQVHSTYSDGYLAPTDLAEFLHKQGVKAAALTDHNTVGGIKEFRHACHRLGMKAVGGIELYAKYGRHAFNLLWYNFDEDSPELHNILRQSQRWRRDKCRTALHKLKRIGFKLDIDYILDKYNHYAPTNRIVGDIMAVPDNMRKLKREMKMDHVREVDVINRYLQHSRVGALKNSYLSLHRIEELRGKIGGHLIFCHPAKYSHVDRDFLAKVVEGGIDGIEVLSPHHSIGSVMHIQHMAREMGLIMTGGSDFHRHEGRSHLIQNSLDYFRIKASLLHRVEEVVGRIK